MNIFKRIQSFFKGRKSDSSNIVYIDVYPIVSDAEVFEDARIYESATIFDEGRVDVCNFDEFDQSEDNDKAYGRVFGKAQVFGNARVYSNC